LIVTYVGYVHAESETDQESDYDLSLERELGVGVDARWMGNEARFINDYRGVKEKANAEFRDCWVGNGRGGWERRMGIWAKEKIGKGDEILVSYGRGFWQERAQVNKS